MIARIITAAAMYTYFLLLVVAAILPPCHGYSGLPAIPLYKNFADKHAAEGV
jgi:hypothetical protein